GRLPGRDRLPDGLHRCEGAGSACEALGEERLRRVPAAGALGAAFLMKVIRTEIPEVLILEPKVFEDPRGFFLESYNRKTFMEATRLDVDFVQDNHSRSVKNLMRCLHHQI